MQCMSSMHARIFMHECTQCMHIYACTRCLNIYACTQCMRTLACMRACILMHVLNVRLYIYARMRCMHFFYALTSVCTAEQKTVSVGNVAKWMRCSIFIAKPKAFKRHSRNTSNIKCRQKILTSSLRYIYVYIYIHLHACIYEWQIHVYIHAHI